jgi:hypothetical protein
MVLAWGGKRATVNEFVEFYPAGSLMTKAVPSPGVLTAHISPLCAATIL